MLRLIQVLPHSKSIGAKEKPKFSDKKFSVLKTQHKSHSVAWNLFRYRYLLQVRYVGFSESFAYVLNEWSSYNELWIMKYIMNVLLGEKFSNTLLAQDC